MPSTQACAVCGTTFQAARSTARYCSSTCRQRARRGRAAAGDPPSTPAEPSPRTSARPVARRSRATRRRQAGPQPLADLLAGFGFGVDPDEVDPLAKADAIIDLIHEAGWTNVDRHRIRIALEDPAVEDRTHHDLEALKKVDSLVGQQALQLARRLDRANDTGSALAAVSRELSRLMTLASAGAGTGEDEVEKARRRRAEKLANARASSS